MKRQGHLYEQICDLENIKTAILKASLGKRHRPKVRRVLEHLDEAALQVQHLLTTQTFVPAPPHERVIYDGASGKHRTISKPRFFPDQIVHWALILQLQPVIMKGMYRYSCGSVPGRGTSDGQRALRRWMDKDPKNTKYCLKMDVAKFYPSIRAEHLKPCFRRKVKDPRCLWLIDTIIDSSEGLPIGYFTSQWFANFFLEDLDHYVKEKLGVPHYIRYVDDLVLLGPNKRKLHQARVAISAFLEAKGLRLKGNWQVFPLRARAIDFLGMRFYRTHTTMRKRNALRIVRRMRRIQGKGRLGLEDACAVVSYWGWVKHTDSHTFYHEHMRPVVSMAAARKVVSLEARGNHIRPERRPSGRQRGRARPCPGL